MENKNIIQQELMETAPTLASISRQMPFALPEGYFDELPLALLGEVMPKKAAMSVPEGYFDSLPALLLQKAKASSPAVEEVELEESYPLLDSIGREMPFHIPVGYFENLQIDIPGKQAPVIPISRPWRKLAGWAVAASILAVVSVFGYRYFSGSANATVEMAENEDGIDGIDSVAAVELASALSELDDAHIDGALDGYSYNTDQNASYYLNTVNFEQALKSLSDEEIKTNLEETGYYHKKS